MSASVVTTLKTITRVLLGVLLVTAGISHFTFGRRGFQKAVPAAVPMNRDTVVLASGGVEIALGAALLLVRRRRTLVGRIAALFFLAVFPGNISQTIHRRNAPMLDTDARRIGRLFMQLPLIVGAVWAGQR